jgi:energy-converting hydrogenase Eha subunit A
VWLAALLALGGLVMTVGWALYAAWLSPQVYAGGVMGAEVYELPAAARALGLAGPALARLALLGLAAGAIAALLVSAPGLPPRLAGRRGWARQAAIGLPVAAGGVLGLVTSVSGWALLVAALGLSSAVLAPGVILTRWSERITSRGLAAGAAVGLLCFAGLTVLHLTAPLTVGPGWRSLVAWPVLLALPAHLAVAWALRARRVSRAAGLGAAHLPEAPGETAPPGPRAR